MAVPNGVERLKYWREEWKAHVRALERVKEDEQRWLLFAFVACGGMLGALFGGFGGAFDRAPTATRLTVFLAFVGSVQVFAWFWARQALSERQ